MDDLIWFTTAQAAAYSGKHEVTVRRALEAKQLHGGQPKARGRWRIHRDCLDAWQLGTACPHATARKSA